MDTHSHELIPPADVLHAFKCEGTREKLPGGEGRSFKSGDYVLKPIEEIELQEWSCEVISQLSPSTFRLSKPLLSTSGTFVYKGWSASVYEEGSHMKGNWQQKVEVGQEFHTLLNRLDRTEPPKSENPHTHSHDVVRGKKRLPTHLHPEIRNHVQTLLGYLRDIPCTHGLIHADLCGNILFSANQPPLIIDFSPAIAPIEYGQAIIVADAIPWENAPLELLEVFPDTTFSKQMMLRAICFRVIVKALIFPMNSEQFLKDCAPFNPLIEKLTEQEYN